MPTTVRRVLIPVVLLGVVIFAAARTQHFLEERAAFQAKNQLQNAVLSDIQSLGGNVGFAPLQQTGTYELAPINSITLTGKSIDSELIVRLGNLSELQRLHLDGTNLDDTLAGQLVSLRKLERLTLANTQISDQTVSQLADLPHLQTLSLSGTAISDESAKSLAKMVSLEKLDVSATDFTADGVITLSQAPALMSLTVDEKCITPKSVEAIASTKELASLNVRVPLGLGRATRDMLVTKLSGTAQGLTSAGHRIWDADTSWDETVAGVVEIVSETVGLNDNDRETLVRLLHHHDFARDDRSVNRQEVEGEEIESVEQFLEAIRTGNVRTSSFSRYGRNKLSEADVPTVLAMVRNAIIRPNKDETLRAGLMILSRCGSANDEVRAIFEQLFSEPVSRAKAFDFVFHSLSPDSEDRWPTSEQFADFAMPHLLAYANDATNEAAGVRWQLLARFASDHPKYASQLLPFYVRWLREGKNTYGSQYLSMVVERNPQAALALLPELHQLLAAPETPRFLSSPTLSRFDHAFIYRRELTQAIACIDGYSPDSMKMVMAELDRMRKGDFMMGYSDRLVLLATANESQTVVAVVRGLLDLASDENGHRSVHAANTLAEVARAIRDRHIAREN